MIRHPGQILHSAPLPTSLILLEQTPGGACLISKVGRGERDPCMCSHPTPTPSSNEISALSKTGFSGPGKIYTEKSVVLWASPNSMLTLYGFTLYASHYGPDLSSHPNPVTERGGKPKRRDICIVSIAF